MYKSFKSILSDIDYQRRLEEAKEDEAKEPSTPDSEAPEENDEDDDEPKKISDHAPTGAGHYTADDLHEIISYVKDILKKERDEDKEDDDEEKDEHMDVGLDLLDEYADMLPETVINQIVDDLKDIFEIEDTMLESIISEGGAFFSKSTKGPAAKAAQSIMMKMYRKNHSKILARNKRWKKSDHGKLMTGLHKAFLKGMGKIKGKRLVHKG